MCVRCLVHLLASSWFNGMVGNVTDGNGEVVVV